MENGTKKSNVMLNNSFISSPNKKFTSKRISPKATRIELLLEDKVCDSSIAEYIRQDRKNSPIEPFLRNLDGLIYENCNDLRAKNSQKSILSFYRHYKCSVVIRK